MKLSKFRKPFYLLLFFLLLLISYSNFIIPFRSQQFIYSEINLLPKKQFGLLLGTSNKLKSGKSNPYFYERVKACWVLFKANKISKVLISGDNSSETYNEPQLMKDALIRLGVPEYSIFLDYAGFDSYDSVIRANKIFGLKSYIIISQEFHNQRSIYIARENNIRAIGYNVDPKIKERRLLVQLREVFARVKAVVEVNLGIPPYFSGKKIKIK